MFRQKKPPTLAELRNDLEYSMGKRALDFIYIGRAKDVQPFRNDIENQFRILSPESGGESWSYEKNMAFMLGVIDQGLPVLIVTPLSDIFLRAKKGYEKKDSPHYETLGFAAAEVLWLLDNSYIFLPDKVNPHYTWATPDPNFQKTISVRTMRPYGFSNDADASEQCQRLRGLTIDLESKKNLNSNQTSVPKPNNDLNQNESDEKVKPQVEYNLFSGKGFNFSEILQNTPENLSKNQGKKKN